jgi:hypothetical protein
MKLRHLLSFALLLTVSAVPALAAPAPRADHQRARCVLVPELLYNGQPVYYGDCVSVAPADLPSETPTPADTETPAPTDSPAPASTETLPVPTETATPLPTATPAGPVAPYPSAPLCADSGALHDNDAFHTPWDSLRACHYDHEHGSDPFVSEVVGAFPGFDLSALLGGVEVGHTNPSSPMENTHKHGGMKWDVRLVNYKGCVGRENVPTGVDALVVQYHGFSDYAVEFETRIHSAVALIRQCQTGNPSDHGYVFVNQHQDYGQRTAPYQGVVLPYPDTPLPAYDPAREPYFAVTCYGGAPDTKCARYPTLQAMVSANSNAETTWISEPQFIAGSGSPLFFLLFRGRDTHQALDAADMLHPFTFRYLCSSDGGVTYDPAMPGCRWNNTTTRVHELGGEIPDAWDGQAFDSDPRVHRITAELFVTRFGALAPGCTAPGLDCHPLVMVGAFTGRYGTGLGITPEKTVAFDPANLAERDIYFCDGVPCGEFDAGAQSSGWVGPEN